ncbi:ABC transporter substrate-binding protein [Terrabacter sp. C0L_2]|uniref:ABC transporter substrate-binding protein n=1 Tax=Terrabacter sp. C0L_2 TaxID=3108389 RepID=UPI002ED4503E|nr:ABC transporter substrate-binding protein [Terrabacter sp. C0L_2]
MVRGLTRSVAAGVGAALLAAGAAACTGSSDPVSTQGALGTAPSASGEPQRGGDLQVLVAGTIATWDPQLMYVGPEAFFAQRTFARGLTAYGTGAHQRDVQADLATDTGTPSDGARTWSFTLRPGVKWQDGSPITCDDVRHGVARTFDRRTHVGGTNYASFLLDMPTQVTPEGLEKPVYSGPGDTAHRADFERAVSCKGSTITFRLRDAEPDFPHIVALPEFAPRKASTDTTSDKASYAVMSSGPYRLKDPWVVGKGGTFVRNEHWDPRTDPIRRAYPDEIRVMSGLGEQSVIQRLLNQQDDDAYAVSWVQASPTLRNQAGTGLQARLTFPYTGNVDYLAVNMRSKVMANPAVRKALALSTNRATYVTATGGEGAGTPTWSILSPTVDPQSVTPPPGTGVEGDPEGARRALQQAGVKLPVPLRVVYARSVLGDKAYAALAAGWERAGFDVQLTSVPAEKYYETIEKPTSVSSFDVFRGVWTPDWPSAGGVLPALFDSRINIDSSGPGQDVGYFSSPAVNALIDKADVTPDPRARAKVWQQADRTLRDEGGYIALSATKALYLHGSGVKSYEDHAVGGIVDLATVAVR